MHTVAAVKGFSPESGDTIRVDGLSYVVQNADQPWSISNPERDTLRFELRPGDVWADDPKSKERSEIDGNKIFAGDKPLDVQYDFKVEPGPKNTSDWLVIGQLHASDNFSFPVFAVELIGERLAFHVHYRLPGEQFQDVFTYIDDAPIVRGEYYHVQFSVQEDVDGKGTLEVWLNGEQVVDYSGYIGYGYGAYWKQGIYRAASSESIAVDFRDLSIQGTGASRLYGTQKADTITPRHNPDHTDMSGNDIVDGHKGNDLIKGGDGFDLLFGGEGNDVLKGGRQADTLIGDRGNDDFYGGPGKDVFAVGHAAGRNVVFDYKDGKDLIALDHDTFSSPQDAIDHFHQTATGAALEFDDTVILFKHVDVHQLDTGDLLFV